MKDIYNRYLSFCFILQGFFIPVKIINANRGISRKLPQTTYFGKYCYLVDNTVQPIVEDVLAVFHSVYDRAHIVQVNKNENRNCKCTA